MNSIYNCKGNRRPLTSISMLLIALTQVVAQRPAFAKESSAPFADSEGYFVSPGSHMPADWAGLRALGMGNAYTSSANDELAVFSNPAGLARSRNQREKSKIHRLSIPGLNIGGNQSAAKALKSSAKPSSWPGKLYESASSSPGQRQFFEAQTYPFFTLGGKGTPTYLFGMPARTILTTQSASGAKDAPVMLFSETSLSGALAIAGSSRAGLFSWGLSARPNMRYTYFSSDFSSASGQDSLNAKTLQNLAKTKAVKTTGTGVDAGVLVTAADYWFPTLAIAVRNIPTGCVDDFVNPLTGKTITMCGSVRKKSSGSIPADTTTGKEFLINSTKVDPTEVRAGFSITPRGRVSGTKVNLRLAVDAYPLPIKSGSKNYGIPNVPVGSLVHAGAEMYFGNAIVNRGFGLRAGMMNSQPTFGATLNFFAFSLEFAHYSEVVGTRDLFNLEKRYLAGLSVDW